MAQQKPTTKKTTAIEPQASIGQCYDVVVRAVDLAPLTKTERIAVEQALIRIRTTLVEWEAAQLKK